MSRFIIILIFYLLSLPGWCGEKDQHIDQNKRYFEFIENKGQWADPVQYKASLPNGALFTEANTLTFHFYDASELFSHHGHMDDAVPDSVTIHHHAYKVHLNGHASMVQAEEIIPTYFNYFIGNDPAKWARRCRAYTHLIYKDLYPSIDLDIYTNNNTLKYDISVHPGASVADIGFDFEGVDDLQIKDDNLVITTSVAEIKELAPLAYQIVDGVRKKVPCRFALNGMHISYVFPQGYDKSKTLVIDPTMIFATYSGSTANNFGYTAAPDKLGFLYAGGSAFGVGYPYTTGAFDGTFNGGSALNPLGGIDMGITKYDTTGTFRRWSTYLGGNGEELPHSFIVNQDDELFVLGTTSSNNFPVTPTAYDQSFNGGTPLNLMNGLGCYYDQGSDIVVARFNAAGDQLLGCTYVGGSQNDGMNTDLNTKYNYADEVRGDIEVRGNKVYVVSTTKSSDFPTTAGTVQPNFAGGTQDGVLFCLDENLSNLLWSTFIGGSDVDALYSIAMNDTGVIYISGGTRSTDLAVDSTAVDSIYQGGRTDGMVYRITNNGDAILNGTYLGSTAYDQAYFVELDRYSNAYVFGQTEIQDSTFIHNAAYFTYGSGQYITKMDSKLDSVIWSTVFGAGNGVQISPTAFLVDLCNKVYLSGWGGAVNQSSNNNAGYVFGMDAQGPYPAGVTSTAPNGSDFYLMVLEDDASALVFGGFFGGPFAAEHVDGGTSRFDRKGKIYQSMCAGCGGYSDMYTSPGAVGPTNNNSCNNGVFKIDFNLPLVVADFHTDSVCLLQQYHFDNTSLTQGNTIFFWDFGDSNTSTQNNPDHQYAAPGTYTVMLIASDTGTCNLSDTTYRTISVDSVNVQTLSDAQICLSAPPDSIQIGIAPLIDTAVTYTYNWTPTTGLSDPAISNPMASPPSTTLYTLMIDDSIGCTDTIYQLVQVFPIQVTADPDTLVCLNAQGFSIQGNASGTAVSWIWSSNPQFSDQLNSNTTDSSFTFTPQQEGTEWFYVQASNPLGCASVDSLMVSVDEVILGASADFNICLGDTVMLVAAGQSPGDVFGSFSWQPTTGIIGTNTAANISVSPSVSTTYTVSAVDQNGCSDGEVVSINVSTLDTSLVSASIDQDTVFLGNGTILHAEPGSGFVYQWSPAEGISDPTDPNPLIVPQYSTTYILTVSDPANGSCLATDTVSVVVQEVICGPPNIFIPNAFTPNGDGENDILYVRGRNLQNLYFTVYDRWGEKVFETTDQSNGWDGWYHGAKADPDVFVWYIEATCADETKYFEKGNVTLIR